MPTCKCCGQQIPLPEEPAPGVAYILVRRMKTGRQKDMKDGRNRRHAAFDMVYPTLKHAREAFKTARYFIYECKLVAEGKEQ